MKELLITTDFDIDSVLTLWQDIFGKEEALLEKIQINGTEKEHNFDLVYTAVEGEEILGTVHVTVPRLFPEFAGISGVCSSPFARGRGVAKILFSESLKKLREMGVKVVFLGTNNPVAAKLYSSFGFSFLRGSGVMVNTFYENSMDYFRNLYKTNQKKFHIVEGTPDFRIPIISLVNYVENQIVLDVNTNVTSRTFFSQNSCMGLFPRYLKLKENGGDYYGAVDEDNLLGAVISTQPTERGVRADFFCCESFEKIVPELIKKCEDKFGNLYFQIANADEKKIDLIKEIGFMPYDNVLHSFYDKCFIPMTLFKR